MKSTLTIMRTASLPPMKRSGLTTTRQTRGCLRGASKKKQERDGTEQKTKAYDFIPGKVMKPFGDLDRYFEEDISGSEFGEDMDDALLNAEHAGGDEALLVHKL